jgi:ribonuclease R
LIISIPKNFIDPAVDREKNKYPSPILSREGLMKLIELHDKKVNYDDFLMLYKGDTEKTVALEHRVRAMIRDNQIIKVNKFLTTLDYWPLEKGTIVKNEKEEYVLLTDSNKQLPLHSTLQNMLFNGDYCQFSIIEPLKTAAFHSLIYGSPVYLEGIVVDANEYELPEGYPLAIKITKGRFKHEVVSGRSLKKKKIQIGQQISCRLERNDQSEYILVDVIDEDFPLGVKKIIKQFNLPAVWSSEIEKESKIFEKTQVKKITQRKDLTSLPFVTIDDITAKDFDDAVYAEPLDNDDWRLFVAIADVAHYVKPGSAIDAEASNRGVSVYFPKHVVPMLPEVLSNELCSLKPNVLRYSLVCEMKLTAQGKITSFVFYPAVIRSHARLTYTQVQDHDIPDEMKESVQSLWKVYSLLHEERKRNGYVFFAQQGVQFVLGEHEKVLEINRVPNRDSHHLIEEMMLAANKCAAQFLQEHSKVGVYRTHEEPSEQKVQLLNMLIKPLNLSLDPPYTLDKIAFLSESLQKQHPRLNTLISRIMQRACYQISPAPHFGLNFKLYSHFTSPIRRYPDLLVHRLIYEVLAKNKNPKTVASIPTALKRVNYLERRAEEAERTYHSYLKVQFVQQLANKTLTASVTGLAEFGLFIELEDYPIDGMVHVSEIDGNYWTLNQDMGYLENGQGGEIKIGDQVRVVLVSANSTQLRISFKLVHDA